jgi:hypothetical protein
MIRVFVASVAVFMHASSSGNVLATNRPHKAELSPLAAAVWEESGNPDGTNILKAKLTCRASK